MNKIFLSFSLLFLFLLYFYLSVPYYSGDVKNHLVWAESLLTDGPMGFYSREFHDYAFPNYPPLAMFLFALSLQLYYWCNDLIWFLNINIPQFPSNLVHFIEFENTKIAFLKLPGIISNFGIAVALYYLVGKYNLTKTKRLLVPLFFLLNPATFYLSVIWGQIDLLPMMFFILAILLLFQKNWILSAFVMILALLSKQTVVVFLPVFIWILGKKYGLKKLAIGLAIMLTIFYLSYLLFNNSSLIWPFEIYKLNFNLVAPSVGENAINLWGVAFNFQRSFDGQKISILSLQQIGYLIFLFIIIIPMLKFLKRACLLTGVLRFCFLLTVGYFLFLTRMHERYLIPVLIFATPLAFIDKRYILGLIFFSLLHFLNLYRGLFQPDLDGLTNIMKNTSVLKVLVIIYTILVMYYLRIFIKDEA